MTVRVGDWVRRRDEFQDSWWKQRCREKYKKDHRDAFRIVNILEDYTLELEGWISTWDAFKFNKVPPPKPFNEADYL